MLLSSCLCTELDWTENTRFSLNSNIQLKRFWVTLKWGFVEKLICNAKLSPLPASTATVSRLCLHAVSYVHKNSAISYVFMDYLYTIYLTKFF